MKIAFAAGAVMFLSAGVAQAQQEVTAHEVFIRRSAYAFQSSRRVGV
jgi:hypothetical protein